MIDLKITLLTKFFSVLMLSALLGMATRYWYVHMQGFAGFQVAFFFFFIGIPYKRAEKLLVYLVF